MLGALFIRSPFSFLAWVALVPLILLARECRPRAAIWYGYLTGLAFCAILMEWVRLFDFTGWIAGAFFQGAYVAAFAWVVRTLAPEPRGIRGILAPTAAWTALEWARSLGPGGFTWGDLAYALAGHLPLMQLASITGPFGLSFLVALVNSSLAAILGIRLAQRAKVGEDTASQEDQKSRVTLFGLFVAVSLVLICWVWGRWHLAQPTTGGATLRVAVLQGNVSGEGSREPWYVGKARESANIYLRLTEQVAQDGADLIIWPESAVPGNLLLSPEMEDIRTDISSTAARLRVNVLVGAAHRDPLGMRLNSAFLFTRDGKVGGRYDKVHLVPYGEYTPWRQRLAFLYRYFPIIDDDVCPGRGYFPLDADAARLGVVICFESAFPGITRKLRNNGAELLAVITNDAWFGYHTATWQHYRMASFRAIESGCYLARAATTGFSGVLNPHGRVIEETQLYTRRAVLCEVRRMPGRTIYTRFGDVVAWVCTLGIVLLLLMSWRGMPCFARR